jgi:hypothetical protein
VAKHKQSPGGNSAAVPQGESMSGYFRKVFDENPKLLDSRSNDELLDRWLLDHPGRKSELGKVRANLANIKSVLRQKRRKRRGGRKSAEATVAMPAHAKIATRSLESLEERIDDCLSQAKSLDRDGLASIIHHLRRARNELVWKMGQKE